MNVLDIINLMGTLSIGNKNVTNTDKETYLVYLNIAHCKLYRDTAIFNESLLKTETIPLTQGSNEIVLSDNPFCINKVYLQHSNNNLKRLHLTDIIEYDPGFIQKGTALGYYNVKNIIKLYPFPLLSFGDAIVWYKPGVKLFNMLTQSQEIPYPVEFHPGLANGALYYLFLDEGGFRSTQKEKEAEIRWQSDRGEILQYFMNSSMKPIRTYSRV